MKKIFVPIILCGWCVAAVAENATNAVPLSEVLGVLKGRYVDRGKLDPAMLEAAALKGLLQELGGSVQVLSAEAAASNAAPVVVPVPTNSLPLARAEMIDPDIGYIRLRDITPETVPALDAELKKCADAKATGYVLDLRFADGTNYEVAASVASRFLADGQELFALKSAEGGRQVFKSHAPGGGTVAAVGGAPVMVLVNGQTRGCAEALAGALRANDRGVVVGTKSAGIPIASEDVKLSNGRVLRVATAKVSLPKGGEVFPGGIVPDVPVTIDAKMERDVVLNALTNVTLTASLQPKQKKKNLSEAELVKAFRGEAMDLPTPGSVAKDDEERDEICDVVLQRAVDILKGIRVLQSWKTD